MAVMIRCDLNGLLSWAGDFCPSQQPSIMWEWMSRIIVELKHACKRSASAYIPQYFPSAAQRLSFFTLQQLHLIWTPVTHPNRNWEEQTWNLKHNHKNMSCNIMQTCHREMDLENEKFIDSEALWHGHKIDDFSIMWEKKK